MIERFLKRKLIISKVVHLIEKNSFKIEKYE